MLRHIDDLAVGVRQDIALDRASVHREPAEPADAAGHNRSGVAHVGPAGSSHAADRASGHGHHPLRCESHDHAVTHHADALDLAVGEIEFASGIRRPQASSGAAERNGIHACISAAGSVHDGTVVRVARSVVQIRDPQLFQRGVGAG